MQFSGNASGGGRPQTFEQHRRLVNAKALRLGIVITVAVQVLFLSFEWLALPEHFVKVQFLRALWLLPAIALFPFLRSPSGVLLRRVDAITWLIYVAAATYIVAVAFLHEGYQSPYIHALILMFVGVCAVTLWRFWFALSFATTVYGIYWTPLLLGYGSISDFTNWIGYQCFLIGTMGILLVSQQLRLRIAAADFERRRQLEVEKAQTRELLERVAVMRRDRLNWLESLARFLRHELKNQMVAMGTSLDMAENGGSATPPEQYLGRARKSLGRMRRLVDSATEATSIEAALALGPTEEIDLSAVVEERVLAFTEIHPHRRFLLDVQPGLRIEGQDDRLSQLVEKLLENAVQHGMAIGEVRVAVSREDSWVLLSVENDGDSLPEDKDALFDAFVSQPSASEHGQNLGLGLFVARAIAQAHSGNIRAVDPVDARGARFEVRFPIDVS